MTYFFYFSSFILKQIPQIDCFSIRCHICSYLLHNDCKYYKQIQYCVDLMMNEQEETLIQSQEVNQGSRQQQLQDNAVRIKNIRVARELQFIKNYKYSVNVNSKEETVITFPDFYERKSQKNDNKTLVMILPSNYPFTQPQFQIEDKKSQHNIDQQIYNKQKSMSSSNRQISQLFQYWTPKYKILQMIELIKTRISQQLQLDQLLENNALYTIIKQIKDPRNSYSFILLVALLAVTLRILVGFGGYSGKDDWPTLGDFEAHRNWMSITVNKPIKQWYYQQLSEPWWRIDYPPIAAYISYIFGAIYKRIQPQALLIQEGYQSSSLTAYMRTTSLIIDIIFMIPANILLYQKLASPTKKFSNFGIFIVGLYILLIKPEQILIDHGHFQYNSIMMGCILYSFYFILTKRYYLCCIFFTVAVNCKQMAIYFALAFLAALVGINLKQNYHYNNSNRKISILRELIIYAMIIIGLTTLFWLPWLTSFDDFKSVFSAIFPIHRGLYQLKVPNFWCMTDIVFKWQRLFSKSFLMVICLGFSTFASIPAFLAILIRPTNKILLLGFSAISMTFFMFSYHGHQKSILLPLLMAPFIGKYITFQLAADVVIGGCVGIYHLLVEDGQTLNYYVLVIGYILLKYSFNQIQQKYQLVYTLNLQYSKISLLNEKFYKSNFRAIYCDLIFVMLHIAKYTIPAPQNLPYLYNLLFAGYSFGLNCYYLFITYSLIFEEIQKFIKTKPNKKQ